MEDTKTAPVVIADPAPGTAPRKLAVLVPSCTDDFLERLLTSMETAQRGSIGSVIVGDNGLTPAIYEKFDVREASGPVFVKIAKPFVFAKAINKLARIATEMWPGCALLVLNDDTEIVTRDWLTVSEKVMEGLKATTWGMVSFEIDGGVGNEEQKFSPRRLAPLTEAKRTVCFVAAMLTRNCWDRVGPLDERFSGYGFDDDDYCRRVRGLDMKCGIATGLVVKHGAAGYPHSSSYARLLGQEEWNRQYRLNARIFAAKWGEGTVANRTCLNIGCGDRPRISEGLDKWINLDHKEGPNVDVVRDLRRGLPFNDGTFDYILADNVLEHFASEDVVFLINEIDRVLKLGGQVEIIVPHFQSQGAVQDPTHKSFFGQRCVLYWNQLMTPYGGKFVGITANLLPAETSHVACYAMEDGREVEPDFAKHAEVFIRFFLTKMPLNARPK